MNVGSESMQGDAGFCRLLEKMGCEVEQTVEYTQVKAPADGVLKPIEIDMGDLTDAFMGAAVLMAVAPGSQLSPAPVPGQQKHGWWLTGLSLLDLRFRWWVHCSVCAVAV